MIDFTRLCERTEAFPELDPRLVWNVVAAFRGDCLHEFPDDIDPAPVEARKAFELNEQAWAIARAIGSSANVPQQIATLLRTPRILKRSLRRVWQAWQELHGEIDFDDLLVANVLRESAPHVFDNLLNHISQIRHLPFPGERSVRPTETIETIEQERQSLANLITTVGMRPGASPGTLVFFLFPMLGHQVNPQRPRALQGVAVSHPTDYWTRLNAEALETNEPHDQDILKLLRDSKLQATKKDELIRKLMEDSAFTDKFEQFASRTLIPELNLDADNIRGLAADLFSETLNKFGPRASADTAPGFYALWRPLLRKRGGNHADWLKREIRKSLARSARFAIDLFYYWGGTKPEIQLLDQQSWDEVYRDMIGEAKKLFADQPDQLISVLDISYPMCVFGLLHPPDRHQASSETPNWLEPDPPDWLGPVLVRAAEQLPQLVVPEIANLVSKEHREQTATPLGTPPELVSRFEISPDLIRKIFGEKLEGQVLKLLAESTILEDADDRTKSMLASLREQAKAELERDGKSRALDKEI